MSAALQFKPRAARWGRQSKKPLYGKWHDGARASFKKRFGHRRRSGGVSVSFTVPGPVFDELQVLAMAAAKYDKRGRTYIFNGELIAEMMGMI